MLETIVVADGAARRADGDSIVIISLQPEERLRRAMLPHGHLG